MSSVAQNPPKVTVVTVCRNAVKEIAATIESVIAQTYDNLEYIIVDGASDDGTQQLIDEYRRRYPISIVSEPDRGIFDAMNKGARLASGDWINFMNAGDFFVAPDVVARVSEYLVERNDIVYGATQFLYNGFSVLREPRPVSHYRIKMPYNHQSLFVKTSLLVEHPFDLRYPLSADYEQVLYAVVAGKVFCQVPLTVAAYNDYGISGRRKTIAIREYATILRTYGRMTPWRRIYYALLPLKVVGRRVLPDFIQRIVYENFVH